MTVKRQVKLALPNTVIGTLATNSQKQSVFFTLTVADAIGVTFGFSFL